MSRGRAALLLTLAVGAGCVASQVSASPAHAVEVTANCDTPSGRDGCNHWYRSAWVSLSWSWDSGGLPQSNCNAVGVFTTDGRRDRSCTVVWGVDTALTKRVWIGIDRTPPVLAPRTSRSPDLGGWFNHPVGFRFYGYDATSGLGSCSSGSYGGPDRAGVIVRGSCRDVAGNVAVGSFRLNFDATPPHAPDVIARRGNHKVALKWSAPDAVFTVIARRRKGHAAKVVFRGAGTRYTDRGLRNKRRYRYTVTVIDRAGNSAVSRLTAIPGASNLLSPADGDRLRNPPVLRWKRVRGATYYNVQLYRTSLARSSGSARISRSRKILSRWPSRTRLRLRRSWRYGGRLRHLAPGSYRWYVWPGYGRLSAHRYGRVLGRSRFVVVP